MHASSTSSGAPARTTAAIFIFVACCLLSAVRLIHDAPDPFHLKVDDISLRSDQRFAALQKALPNQGVFGYLGESDNSALPDYFLAQYALAPRVIDHSPNHPLVIGNFPSSQPALSSSNLKLIRDFGNGVLLFANQDAK